MRVLKIGVADRIATYKQLCGDIICGNSDYVIGFTFDDEWATYATKTARFVWNGQYKDVEFTGDTCSVPIIQNTNSVSVGVYAGQLQTTTSAVIGCKKSILCGDAVQNAEDSRIFVNQAERAADRAELAADLAEQAAVRAEKLATLPVAEEASF